jgi:hypothetical protein
MIATSALDLYGFEPLVRDDLEEECELESIINEAITYVEMDY